jgi:hypothetical protein
MTVPSKSLRIHHYDNFLNLLLLINHFTLRQNPEQKYRHRFTIDVVSMQTAPTDKTILKPTSCEDIVIILRSQKRTSVFVKNRMYEIFVIT